MDEIIELFNECNEFIAENPIEYGLELTVKEVKIITVALKILIEFKETIEGGETDAGNKERT